MVVPGSCVPLTVTIHNRNSPSQSTFTIKRNTCWFPPEETGTVLGSPLSEQLCPVADSAATMAALIADDVGASYCAKAFVEKRQIAAKKIFKVFFIVPPDSVWWKSTNLYPRLGSNFKERGAVNLSLKLV